MSYLRRFGILLVLWIATLACGLFSRPVTPTAIAPASPTVQSSAATNTPAPTSTVEATAQPSDTPAPTLAAAATDTPNAQSLGLAPFANLEGGVAQYFDPVGQPVQTWNGIPIMPQATAGQEFKPGVVYSFKAGATRGDAANFYQSKLPALGFTSLMAGPATGSSGSGSNTMKENFLWYIKGTQTIIFYIASYDSDPAHVIVVIAAQ